ncbi:septum site-determining protein MinC [Blochmannia endosymbiont of Camponotus modoc]|uniref:septum site-determining protein MinC n=1 Tax=Blochmannia endosymbiont of Camponotus modoc TaxID=2945587 RepID=UPI0020257ED6|nr:septum site-determining protein MinC [Blochmannia endosymbiont of Camponotus modoc]URJ26353.1 septum site-determining protein MinC [Blochmannia endosymbiont of Camponotus modoc]URJ31608.1 septum site-determining protein MinC [Blochmannia endosymbiont of Camponotus modoc]
MSISIKGSNFTLLVIHVYSTCIGVVRRSLEEKIKKAPFFLLKNTPVVINVGNLNYCNNWDALCRTISDAGLFIVGVCCCHDNKLKEIIIRSGIPILTQGTSIRYKYCSECLQKKIPIISKTQLINTPIRSGQKIYARNRDLIVIANVNAGAEIIADGNIHIYGTMRGRVLAGASGSKESQIFCTRLSPELVSIGGRYWLSDQIPKEFSGKSVRLSLKDDMLIIQNL